MQPHQNAFTQYHVHTFIVKYRMYSNKRCMMPGNKGIVCTMERKRSLLSQCLGDHCMLLISQTSNK